MIEVHQVSLSDAERGNHALPLYPFFRACQILKKDANWILGRKRRAKEKGES